VLYTLVAHSVVVSSEVLLALAKKQLRDYLKLFLSSICGFGSEECKKE